MNELLSELGMSQKEQAVFLYVVGKNGLSAYEIAKKTRLNRSTVYDVLEKLKESGYVREEKKGKKSLYFQNDLNRVISGFKEKQAVVEQLMKDIAKLGSKKDVEVLVLEGTSGQREYFLMLFRLATEGKVRSLHIMGNGEVSTVGSNVYIKKLISDWKKSRAARLADYKCIWNEKYRGQQIVKDYNPGGKDRFYSGLPDNLGIEIFGEYVSFLFTFEKPYVVLIKNQSLSKSMEFYFSIVWNLAKD